MMHGPATRGGRVRPHDGCQIPDAHKTEEHHQESLDVQ
jgi:hypothetical protein